jgi:hypothetical protein
MEGFLMLRIRPVLAMFGCALILSGSPTSIISNDISNQAQDLWAVVDDGHLGASFSTGATAYQLTSVLLVLSLEGEVPSAVHAAKRPTSHSRSRRASAPVTKTRQANSSVLSPRIVPAGTTVTLWSDNGLASPNNGPAAQLAASTTTVLDTSLTNTPTAFTFLFSNFQLAANTRYWIVASSPSANSGAEWWTTFNISGTDISTEFDEINSEVFPNAPAGDPGADEAFLIQVNGLAAAAPPAPSTTPAPSSVKLVLIGLGCAALYLERRRRLQSS